LLTTGNPAAWQDADLLARLGMQVAPAATRPAPVAAE
ncbi:MAG: biotin synthase, partial [Pseudodonghicola sp.]